MERYPQGGAARPDWKFVCGLPAEWNKNNLRKISSDGSVAKVACMAPLSASAGHRESMSSTSRCAEIPRIPSLSDLFAPLNAHGFLAASTRSAARRELLQKLVLLAYFNRLQSALLPATIDEYVSEENPVRVIDAFVGALDLAALGHSAWPSTFRSQGRQKSAGLSIARIACSVARISWRVGFAAHLRTSRFAPQALR